MQAESKKSMNQLKEMIRKDDETKRFIRCRQGVELYNMSRPQFVKLAIEAGALYKINRHVLINKKAFDENFQKYRVEKGAPSYEKGKYKSVESNQSIS